MLNHKWLPSQYTQTMSIGARVRQLRKKNKLSQEKLGELCGVTKGMVSQWESGTSTPPIDRLIELSKHVYFSFDWMLKGELSIGADIEAKLTVEQKQAWYRIGRILSDTPEEKH